MLVDYDESSNEEQEHKTQTKNELQNKINQNQSKQNIKRIGIDELMAISKKVKTNQSTDIRKEFSEDTDTWNPNHYDRENLNVTMEKQTISTKYQMNLPKPLSEKSFQISYNQRQKQNLIPKQKKIPPPPPGMSFVVAEQLAKSLLRDDDDEQKQLVQEFDNDDLFIRDLKKMRQAGEKNYTVIDSNDAAQYGMNINENLLQINGSDLLNMDWKADQAKKMQAQEQFMKVKLQDPSQLQKEKNHISSLLQIAAEKEQEFDARKQEKKYQIQQAKNKYGW